MKRSESVSVFLFLFIISQSLFSQITIEGHVSTPGMNPEPVEGALVELIDQANTTQVLSNTTTDAEGYYSIQIPNTGIKDGSVQKPEAFQLFQNYPNPFNPSTIISYALPHPTELRIEIYNVLGQKIRTLMDSYQSNPIGRVIWDGTADNGKGVSAGIYFYSLIAEGVRINKKMLLLDGHTGKIDFSGNALSVAKGSISLNKSMSTNYFLRVSGDSLSTVQDALIITENLIHDVSIYRTMIDQDNNVYKIIRIGNQWWMVENLKVTTYRNGDPISNVTESTEWIGLTTGGYCYYNNDINNAADFGALYNWYAVDDSRNIAPTGWHVPTDEEWKQLEMYLGMSQSEADEFGRRGSPVGGKLKETGTIEAGTGLWHDPNTDATNESGFTVRPGGYCYKDGIFYDMSSYTEFWSSTEHDSIYARGRELSYEHAGISRGNYRKLIGFSVRLVRDDTNTMTDQDGNVYQTVKIGNQWWMAENLKVTTYRNGDPIPNVTDSTDWVGLTTGGYCYYNNDNNNAADFGAL